MDFLTAWLAANPKMLGYLQIFLVVTVVCSLIEPYTARWPRVHAVVARVAAIGIDVRKAVAGVKKPTDPPSPTGTAASMLVLLVMLSLAACQLTGSDFQKLGTCSAKYDACYAVADVAFKEKRMDADGAMALFKTCRAQVDVDCVFVEAAPSSSAKTPPSASAAPAASVTP